MDDSPEPKAGEDVLVHGSLEPKPGGDILVADSL